MVSFFRSLSSRGRFVLLVAALAGLPLAFSGVMQLYRTNREISTGLRVKGVVIRSQEAQGGYYPVVRFEAVGQGIMRFTDRSGSYQAEFQDGQEVEVIYQQYEPEKARIYTPQRLWFAPVLMASAGLLPLVIGVLVAWFTERKTQISERKI
ncbi:MAG: DUF3592 domain-containing protein [Candidatus Kapabacteria bacterium]|nr:DUF3592 domain-containing protein [Candidatus Kapabacteria bacterium]